MERHAAQVAQRLDVQQVLRKQDRSVSLFLLDHLKMAMMDVPYLGEGWLDFAVFIPPARKNSVKAEYVSRIHIWFHTDSLCDSQQDALGSLQQFAACGVDEDPIFFQRGTCQATGPGAATVASNTISIPAEAGMKGRVRARAFSGLPAISLLPGGLLIQGVGALKIRQRRSWILPGYACRERNRRLQCAPILLSLCVKMCV